MQTDIIKTDIPSPLNSKKPKERTVGANFILNPADFDEHEEVGTEPLEKEVNASDFDDDSPSMPDYEKVEGQGNDVQAENDKEREAVITDGQKNVIDFALDGVKIQLPKGVHWFTKTNEEKLNKWAEDNYIFNAAYRQQADNIAKANQKNLGKFQFATDRYVGFIDKPIRQIFKDRQIVVSPEMQVIGATIIFVAYLGYIAYSVQRENAKLMAKFELSYAESMKIVEKDREKNANVVAEQARQAEADKARKVEHVTAEEVES